MPAWIPVAVKGIRASGMIPKCELLADAFRAKNLPVIFVHADGNPIGAVPAYGDLFRQIEASGKYASRKTLSEEELKLCYAVIPEMEYDPSTDEVLCNWLSSPFNISGLELALKRHKVDTVVWGGFALQSACYTGVNASSDFWFNNILCVDASYVCVPPVAPGYHEGLDEIVAEAVIRVMAPAVCHCTDTATVIEKLNATPVGRGLGAR